MLPVDFPQRNFVYEKPNNMTDEECSDLPVFRGNTDDGYPCIISCWKFSKEDLEQIQRTGTISLSVTSNGMPPVSLFTEHPFVEPPTL